MKNNIYTIYSEYTPNPKVMKFVCNQIISSEMIEFDNTPTQNNFFLVTIALIPSRTPLVNILQLSNCLDKEWGVKRW